jgi:hypothetical protein
VRTFFSAVRDVIIRSRGAKMTGSLKETINIGSSHGNPDMICRTGQNDLFHKGKTPQIKLSKETCYIITWKKDFTTAQIG